MADNDGTAAHLWPSAEQHLLLEAALRDGAPSVAAFRAWCARVDLDADFSYQTVRLLPLVYENMQRQGLSDPLMGRLKGVYRRAWYDTHRLFHRVQPVVAALVAGGVEVLLVKGAPLALAYYRNHALRPMADVDIMVAPADAGRALEILGTIGWCAIDAPDADVFRFRHAVQCIGPGGAEIDLHWHVLYEAASDDADRTFRATAEPLDFLGSPVRQLDPTGLLLLVVVHGMRWNDETPIRWIPDALTILRRRGADVDWERMVAFAAAHRLTHRLGLGLAYLAGTFSAPVPREILARLRARRVSLVERVERTVLLADNYRLRRSVLATQWVSFVEYCRYADTRGPLAFISGFSHYLRFRMKLGGRREILPLIVRGVGRRIAHRPPRVGAAQDDT